MIVEKGYGLVTPEHLVRRRMGFKALGDLVLGVGLVVEDFARDCVRTPCLLRLAILLRPDGPMIVDSEQFGVVGGMERELERLRPRLADVPAPKVLNGPVGLCIFYTLHGRPPYEPVFGDLFSGLDSERSHHVAASWSKTTGAEIPLVEQKQYCVWKEMPREKPGWRNLWGLARKHVPTRVLEEKFDPEVPLFPHLAASVDLEQFGVWLAGQPDPEQVPLGMRGQYLHRIGERRGAGELFDRLVERNVLDERSWMERGRHRLDQNDLEPALRDFDKALAMNPEFVTARLFRAIVLQELEATDDALLELERCLKSRPAFLDARTMRVRLLMNEGRMEQAHAELVTWREFNPHDAEAIGRWIYASRTLGRLGPEAVQQMLREADRGLRLDPENRGLALERIYLLAGAGDWADVIRRADETLATTPAFHEVRRMKACGLIESGQPAKARDEFSRAIADAPPGTNGNYWTERARSHLLLGDPDAAIADTEQALAISEADFLALFLQGEAHLVRQDGAAALGCFSTLASRSPGDVVLHEKKGVALTMLGRIDQAASEFDQALAVEPDRPQSLFFLAMGLRHSGKHAEALERLNAAARSAPRHPPLLWERARLLAELNAPDESLAQLNQLLELVPDLPDALRLRAALHENRRDFPMAEVDLNRLVKLFPDAIEPFWRRARMWTLAGNDELAGEDLQRAITRQPEHAGMIEAWRELARAEKLHREEQDEAAIAVLDALLANDPANHPARFLRGACYWYDGQFVEAEEEYSTLIETAEQAGEPQRELLHSALSARGQVLAETGEYERAIEDLTRVIDGDGGNPSPLAAAYSRSGRGFACASLGRFREAREDFQEAIQVCPENAWLHFNQGRMLLLEGKPDEAMVCFGIALESRLPSLNRRQRQQAEALLARHRLDKSPPA
jgi:tetratricopeptide (TPR) repeat protein